MRKRIQCTLMLSTLALLIGLNVSSPALAAPPAPSPGTAVVDGNPAEWNLVTDFFANMHRAGKADFPLESKLYLRYNCLTMTLYALILAEPGIPCLIGSGTAWIAINAQNMKKVLDSSGNDGIPPDFAWIGAGFDGDPTHARGYEASFQLAPGSYAIIAHVNVFDSGGGQTSATIGFPNDGPDLVIDCQPVPVEHSTWSGVKALYQ